MDIPDDVYEEAKGVMDLCGHDYYKNYHLLDGVKPIHHDNLVEMYINNLWRPTLTVTGIDGIPSTVEGGNVIRTDTTVKVVMKIAPTLDAAAGLDFIKTRLTTDVPFGAKASIFNTLAA